MVMRALVPFTSTSPETTIVPRGASNGGGFQFRDKVWANMWSAADCVGSVVNSGRETFFSFGLEPGAGVAEVSF